MKYSVIITAGGVGKRMKAKQPKQFLVLQDKPILMHTIEKFYQFDQQIEIIVVLPKDQISTWNSLCKTYNFSREHTIVEGGKERFHSVKNGLQKVTRKIVGVHDAVRPLVSVQVIEACFITAEQKGSAIPVVKLKESIRSITSASSKAEDRSKFRNVQTPQCFSAKVLFDAYATEYVNTFTDDASVAEMMGHEIFLVDGNEENIKITTPTDLVVANVLLEAAQSNK